MAVSLGHSSDTYGWSLGSELVTQPNQGEHRAHHTVFKRLMDLPRVSVTDVDLRSNKVVVTVKLRN